MFRTFIRSCSYKAIKRPKAQELKTSPRNIESASPDVLSKAIRMQIQATGPMTIADYMRRVLTNPSGGYYMHRDMLGKDGDFVTSPELSQVFGELVAVWLLMEWQKLGSPQPTQLIELGPGRGTLVQDILKVMAHFRVPDLSVHLVEISPHLASVQANLLCYRYQDNKDDGLLHYKHGETVSGIPIYWYNRIEDVPLEFSLMVAHEFFDALPIHKLQRVDGNWREILVDIAEEETKFRFVVARNETPISKIITGQKMDADHLEYSPEQERLCQQIAQRLESHGGCGLIMDYGNNVNNGDSFRAFRKHQLHDPLVDPGTADLTADVDFYQLKRFLEQSGDDQKCITFGPITQSHFLKQMGGDTRVEMLLKKVSREQEKQKLRDVYEMLTSPTQMGDRFKFFSVYPNVLADHLSKYPPTGFNS